MTEPRITRRAAIEGAALAGAALLLPPVAGAAAVERSDSVSSLRVGSLAGESVPLLAPREFSLVGVEWAGPREVRIELRTRRRGGGWSRWALASLLGHDPDEPAQRAGLFGEPIWTGAADCVQLRVSGRVTGVRVHFVSVPRGSAAHAASAFPLATPVLDAGSGQPPIIARAAWARGQAPPAVAPHYGTVKLAFVHHSQTPNGYTAGEVPAIILSIFDYHRYVRGYWDIAYNFLVDAYGRIWEGRAGGIDEPVLGAHAGGYNSVSTGMVVLGSFSGAAPPPAAIGALEQLLAWKLSLHGVPASGRATVLVRPTPALDTRFPPGTYASLPRIAGHRDGDFTDCPGDALYARLPAIRRQAVALAGTPVRATIAPASGAVLAGAPLLVSGRLTSLAGSPAAGAPVELQLVHRAGAATIATVTTDASGAWSESVTLDQNARLRALHRPAPASVSDPVAIAVAPVLTAVVDSTVPLQISGTVSPPKHRVTIDVYARGRLVRRKRVAVTLGRFSARFGIARPGSYVAVARTAPDASNAAGASAPVTFTV
jgi:hypothetical protein